MKKGTKKFTANSENFNLLQLLRGCIKDDYNAINVKWCGNWNGMNWESLSFYCAPKMVDLIKADFPNISIS